ncbi:MAG: beta-propeller fold lactonase family protein [Alphaproteobacteria bacterium]|nr:beta-propeller fold lactonase family protein [Alphaproteobacteria bacterium]MDE1985781.1 beta-propeller fold lactonase family protein [Alphaproteobacteria bacterium]MDE2163797.1 beta-propeller fold lactonase family protein [Alphaproteobacteria bacterium]MDE2264321.1 beta-propeller fold lactonase family protein [Alphaproteobacteria bacterium]
MKTLATSLAALVLAGSAATAQIAVSANDGEIVQADGRQVVPSNPEPDTATVIDLNVSPPRVVGEVAVRASVIGPPESVAISRDRSYALITGATKINPDDRTKYIPDDVLSVVDLKSPKPRVLQVLHAGLGASGVSISPTGALALVCNRAADTVSIFTIAGMKLTPAGTLSFPVKSSPADVVFTPDGTKALVTRDGDSAISLLAIDGTKVTDTGDDIYAGLRPYGIDMSAKGDIAVAANIGRGGRDNSSISVIDLKSDPIHVVNTVSVGPTPEGLALSVDGKYLAVSSDNGTDKASSAPGYHEHGYVQVFLRKGFGFAPVAMAKTGRWCEGVAWSKNDHTLLVQCMVEKRIFVYAFDGKALKHTGAISVKGGPAGIRTE